MSGSASVDDLYETLDLPEDEDIDSNTVNGLVQEKTHHLPKVGDHFQLNNYEGVVTRTARRRVTEVRFTHTAPAPVSYTHLYLKSKNPGVKVVAVEPATSPVLSKGRIRGDKLIVMPNKNCCFQPPPIKLYSVTSFIWEHPNLFPEYNQGMKESALCLLYTS